MGNYWKYGTDSADGWRDEAERVRFREVFEGMRCRSREGVLLKRKVMTMVFCNEVEWSIDLILANEIMLRCIG